jgi:hypothetical protein
MAARQSAGRSRATSSVTPVQSSIQAGHADQPLNRRRALRMLGALAAAAAGVAALSAARPENASAYSQTEGSTDFTGPIRATGGNSTIPDGAAVIANNPNGGVGVYGTSAVRH